VAELRPPRRGNIRERKNVLERAAILYNEGAVRADQPLLDRRRAPFTAS
jgi:DNA-binding NtrC family response regulator